MKRFDYNHLAHVIIVLWQIEKFMCYCNVFNLLYFVFEGNSKKYKPPRPGDLCSERGDLTKGFLRCEFGRLIFGGAYFRNFTLSDLLF